MREIKFRGRNADVPACWIYGYFVIENGSCYIINDDGKFPIIVDSENQYIGLDDKNDKEIYEKDVVTVDAWTGIRNVVIIGISSRFYGVHISLYERMKDLIECPGGNTWYTGIEPNSYSPSCELEVIGNDWENPELLEESK